MNDYTHLTEYAQRAVATNKRRNATESHKNAVKVMAQIREYAKAMAEARKAGLPAPFINDFVSK